MCVQCSPGDIYTSTQSWPRLIYFQVQLLNPTHVVEPHAETQQYTRYTAVLGSKWERLMMLPLLNLRHPRDFKSTTCRARDFKSTTSRRGTLYYRTSVPNALFLDICTLFSGARGSFLALSAEGHAGGPPVHHGASLKSGM